MSQVGTIGVDIAEHVFHVHRADTRLIALGHEVRLIAPAYVKPFVKRNKNDALDAEAIWKRTSARAYGPVPG